jgi:hypothetical protein
LEGGKFMRRIIIPLNAFDMEDVMKKGQGFFISLVHDIGADGVEIRRELISGKDLPLAHLKQTAKERNLYTVFSASIELWKEDGLLNKDQLNMLITEAVAVGVGSTLVNTKKELNSENLLHVTETAHCFMEKVKAVRQYS